MKLKILLLCAVSAGIANAQYGGPTVLSRGSLLSDEGRGMPLGFQFFAGVSGTYDTGFVPVSVDKNGNLVDVGGLVGVEANVGLRGTRRWKKSGLGVAYNGDYRHYSENTYFDGSDHILSLDGKLELSKRVSLITQNAVGSVSRTVGGLSGSFGNLINTPDPLIGIPSNSIFDNRTYYLQTTDGLEFQKSARLSFVMGGDGFFVRRQSKALIGVNGYGGHGSIAYRVNRVTTLDIAYAYLHFDYPRSFGESDIHQVTVGIGRRLNNTWDLSLQGGTFRTDTIGVTQVALDPATAALFGQQTSVQAFHAVKYLPALAGTLSGKFKRTNVRFNYSRTPSPGNGVYLTSTSETATGSVSYQGTSRLSVSLYGGYTSYSSIGQVGLGKYSSGNGGTSLSYRFTRYLHAAASYDARQQQIDRGGIDKLGSRVMLSLQFSPDERPLTLWH